MKLSICTCLTKVTASSFTWGRMWTTFKIYIPTLPDTPMLMPPFYTLKLEIFYWQIYGPSHCLLLRSARNSVSCPVVLKPSGLACIQKPPSDLLSRLAVFRALAILCLFTSGRMLTSAPHCALEIYPSCIFSGDVEINRLEKTE